MASSGKQALVGRRERTSLKAPAGRLGGMMPLAEQLSSKFHRFPRSFAF